MTTTTYNPARAARIAAFRALRARIARAVVRFRNGAQVTAAIASGALVTIGAHLTNLGADEDFRRRYASHAGKRVKAAYLALTGVDPQQIWTIKHDRAIQVCAYAPTDPALNCGLRAYTRTAHLVAA
ncbi:hypothetical protein [Nocardia sp. NPDC049707]|uniref:hypothetical protein n=1 Tax=Nocardia sp. NPDC049707 TaxID=3154735 RepID=UPI00342287C7